MPSPTLTDPPPIRSAPNSEITLQRVRIFLLLLVAFALAGSLFELLLIDHDERWQQQIPLYLIGVSLAILLGHAIVRTAWTVRLVQVAMLLLMLSGAVGAAMHFQSNIEFQRELEPSVPTGELVWKSLSATAPPALAPFVLAQLGLVGLIACYRHPATRRAPQEEN
jgi:hypothetical protein